MKIIYICIVFVLIIILMFLLILFIIEYAIKSELVITEVMNYTENDNTKRKLKIHPRENSDHNEEIHPKPVHCTSPPSYLNP